VVPCDFDPGGLGGVLVSFCRFQQQLLGLGHLAGRAQPSGQLAPIGECKGLLLEQSPQDFDRPLAIAGFVVELERVVDNQRIGGKLLEALAKGLRGRIRIALFLGKDRPSRTKLRGHPGIHALIVRRQLDFAERLRGFLAAFQTEQRDQSSQERSAPFGFEIEGPLRVLERPFEL